MNRFMVTILAVAITSIASWILPLGFPVAIAETKIDTDKIYYGDVRKYSRPAVVDAAKVYRHIPAHQEILSRKLDRDDPDYWPLMRKASQGFIRALSKVCRSNGYDLVGEVRTITVEGKPVPEITDEVIDSLAEKPKGEDKKDPPKAAKP